MWWIHVLGMPRPVARVRRFAWHHAVPRMRICFRNGRLSTDTNTAHFKFAALASWSLSPQKWHHGAWFLAGTGGRRRNRWLGHGVRFFFLGYFPLSGVNMLHSTNGSIMFTANTKPCIENSEPVAISARCCVFLSFRYKQGVAPQRLWLSFRRHRPTFVLRAFTTFFWYFHNGPFHTLRCCCNLAS